MDSMEILLMSDMNRSYNKELKSWQQDFELVMNILENVWSQWMQSMRAYMLYSI